MAAKQPRVQATIVGVHRDGTGPPTHHSPAGYGRDALLHMRPPRSGTWPTSVGPAGAGFGVDRCYGRRTGAGGTRADPPRPGRRVPRGLVGVPDGHGRRRRSDPWLGLDLESRPAAPVPGGQGGSTLRACEAAAGAPPGGGTPASRHALDCYRARRVAPSPSSHRPRRATGKHGGRSSSDARGWGLQGTVEGVVTPGARRSCRACCLGGG